MLDGFFVIESWRFNGSDLGIRLVPDHFEEGLVDPVFTISVNEIEDVSAAEEALRRRSGELIVALEVSERTAALYAEHDDEPASLRGRAVSVTRGAYSVEDLCGVIRQRDQELRRCYEQLKHHRSVTEDVEVFVSGLIRRAEIKRDRSSRDSAPLNLELDALQRVLRRLRHR